MIQGMDCIGDGNTRGNKVVNGDDNLDSAHALAHLPLFVNEQNTGVGAAERLPLVM